MHVRHDLCYAFYNNHINHRGVCRISQGRGPNLKIFGLRVGMSQAIAMGFGGMHPQENFLKWCNFVRFKGYFQPLS